MEQAIENLLNTMTPIVTSNYFIIGFLIFAAIMIFFKGSKAALTLVLFIGVFGAMFYILSIIRP